MRTTPRRLGTLTGLTVGLVEAALVLSGSTETFDRWFEWLLMPGAGAILYSLGGALGGTLAAPWLRERRLPWMLLFAAGASWLWKCRWMTVQPARFALAIGGTLVAAGLLALLLRPSSARLAARVARLATTAAALLFFGGFARTFGGPRGALDLLYGAIAAAAALLVARRLARLPRNEALLHALLAAVALQPAAALLDHVTRRPVDRRVTGPTALRDAPDVVLVTWDTVRADSLPCFGGAGLDTPHLDRLVREGALFSDCRAVAPSTAPAHTSMLTGLYPPRHGLRSNGDTAPPIAAPRLPELLAAAGWRTGGFVSTYVLRKDYGFDRGFHWFDDRGAMTVPGFYVGRFDFGSMLARKLVPPKLREEGTHTPGRVTLARAQEWLARTPQPAFLWAHFYDAHLPFTPEAPFRERTLARAAEGPDPVDPGQRANMVAQRAEIELLDHLLGQLLSTLEARDPGLQRTWIALLADHGECFGEGDLVGHHRSLYDATQQIAWVLRPPTGTPGLPPATRVELPSNQVDLLPTLCEALALEIPEGDGRSLLPAWRGEEFPERGFYMEAFQSELLGRRLQGWSERGFDLVKSLDGERRLLAPGAGAPRDVAAEEPAVLERLEQRLAEFLATHAEVLTPTRELSAEEKRALEALGYTGDG